jgi:hypothetical protein
VHGGGSFSGSSRFFLGLYVRVKRIRCPTLWPNKERRPVHWAHAFINFVAHAFCIVPKLICKLSSAQTWTVSLPNGYSASESFFQLVNILRAVIFHSPEQALLGFHIGFSFVLGPLVWVRGPVCVRGGPPTSVRGPRFARVHIGPRLKSRGRRAIGRLEAFWNWVSRSTWLRFFYRRSWSGCNRSAARFDIFGDIRRGCNRSWSVITATATTALIPIPSDVCYLIYLCRLSVGVSTICAPKLTAL